MGEMKADLEKLSAEIKEEVSLLESSLAQLDQYQLDVQKLRQNILLEEQQLRSVTSPAYVAKNRDKALTEQSAAREKIRSIQSKITAFNERIKLVNQRGSPDPNPLKYDLPLETHF